MISQSEKKKIAVLIVDDHKKFIEGIRAALENNPSIVIHGQACNGEEALDILSNTSCDVVLLDINMPRMNGFEACKKIKELYPGTKVLALSMHTDREHIVKMVQAGADGYAMKNIDPEELSLAIDKVWQGEYYFSSEVELSRITCNGSTLNNSVAKSKILLSKREIDIIRLLAEDMTPGQIGQKLFISETTVETHRRNIIQKLSVSSSVGMIEFALQHGLILKHDPR